MSQIHLIAHLIAKTGREEELKSVVQTLWQYTQAEPGALSYRLFASTRTGRFFFDETWASQEAIDLHVQTPHFQAAVAQLPELIVGELEIDFLAEYLG